MRSHKLNELRIENVGQKVTLSGWVSKIRDLGSFAFIDLRDRYGITQVVINNENLLQLVKQIKNEFVIKVDGVVLERKSKNPNLLTGDIEVEASNIEILSASAPLPFEINNSTQVNENIRLKYRYLDLRNRKMTHNIVTRSNMLHSIRNFLNSRGFLDIDTPVFAKSTPEGARDFLVPSRLHKNHFYALPQSPQLFKQTLMISGLDRYYQVAKCFRDEDLRADRQLEFIQVDIEMSFVKQEDVMENIESLAKHVMKDIKGIDISNKFPVITYNYAMNTYGSDKPDTRYELHIKDFNFLKNMDFDVYNKAPEIRGLILENAEDISRKKLKEYEDFVKTYHGLKGLAYVKVNENGEISSSLSKFLKQEHIEKLNLPKNSLALIGADKKNTLLPALGALRVKLAQEFGLVNNSSYNYLWVIDFPMFEWNEEENRYQAQHHPFTSVKKEDLDMLISDEFSEVRTNAYDLVLNGYEIGGGSIRVHDEKMQSLIFDKLGLSKEEQEQKFGFFLETLKYGVPPHGGFAFGFDRWLMVLLEESSIKEVIPFPKTNKGQDLMTNAPSTVDESQLDELNIYIKE